MNPPKRDAWSNPDPRGWRHVWAKFDHPANTRPMPGLLLARERRQGRWYAHVVWLDYTLPGDPITKSEWVDYKYLRPAESDCNVWNGNPHKPRDPYGPT